MSTPSLFAPVTGGQVDALRATLVDSTKLPVYADVFSQCGLTDAELQADPAAALARLPLFQSELHAALARQSLARRAFDLGGVELSSGTGGPSKRRIVSEADVALDAALLTRLLHLAGVRATDRVAALELAVTPLAAAFLEGCERLGVRDSTALAWRPGADGTPLRQLAPSVLIAPPSLLEQLTPDWSGLRFVIYNGDRLGRAATVRLQAAGVGVRSLYGLTETSALGISCPAESGVHLSPEQALYELRPLDRDHELIVTTLGFSMPLLRYPTGDRVRPLPGRCPCGSAWRRIDVLGRLGTRFSLFEVETSVDELRACLFGEADLPLQVVVSSTPAGRGRMVLHLPPETREAWRAYRRRLHDHPTMGYLLTTGLVEMRFQPLEGSTGRKVTPLIDHRSHGEPPDAG